MAHKTQHRNLKLIFSLLIQIITFTLITCFSIKETNKSLDNGSVNLMSRLKFLRIGAGDNKAPFSPLVAKTPTNYTDNGFKVIKEVTVEEILDVDPEVKMQMLRRLTPPNKPEEPTMDLIAAESAPTTEKQHVVKHVLKGDERIRRVALPRKQVNLIGGGGGRSIKLLTRQIAASDRQLVVDGQGEGAQVKIKSLQKQQKQNKKVDDKEKDDNEEDEDNENNNKRVSEELSPLDKLVTSNTTTTTTTTTTTPVAKTVEKVDKEKEKETVAAVIKKSDPISTTTSPAPSLTGDSRESKQLLMSEGADDSASGTRPINVYQDGLGGRTRITLNAGYIRNSNSNGNGNNHNNNNNQLSVTTEKPPSMAASVHQQLQHQQLQQHHHHHQQRDKIGSGMVGGDDRLERFHSLQSAQVGGSKVIFVPDRIILAEDILQPSTINKQQQQLQLVVTNVSKHLAKDQKRNRTTTLGVGKPDSRCPKTGILTLEHPNACDKYFYCEDGLISEQTCPNGLLYGTRDVIKDYCVYRWTTTCGDKSIPNPISSPGCRWQYGIFTIQGSPKCSQDYYECSEGKYKVKRCPQEGQVYDDRSKSCKPSSMIGCGEQTVADFHCPPDDQGNTYWPFPRYFLNDNSLIHCINEKPELVKCNKEEKVDPVHLHCVPLTKRIQINKQESLEREHSDSGEEERVVRRRRKTFTSSAQ